MEHEDRTSEMTLEKMKEIVDLARESEFNRWEMEQEAWQEVQRLKAPAIINLLRAHLPAEALQGGQAVYLNRLRL